MKVLLRNARFLVVAALALAAMAGVTYAAGPYTQNTSGTTADGQLEALGDIVDALSGGISVGSVSTSGTATAAAPSYMEGSTTAPLSFNLTGDLRTSAKQNGTWTVTGAGGTFPATQSGTWTVQPGNTANTTPWLTSVIPATSGGLSAISAIVPNNTTGVSVKGSAGQLYHLTAFNNSGTIAYVKFYNTASAPTCGSGTPVLRMMIPANTSGAGFVNEIGQGYAFGTGIGYCVTTGIADNDTTAPAANTYLLNIGYK